MRFRQVHLDFHTSELIKGIGSDFSKEQFQKMLQLGHVDSITVFAKCHHGWAYFPSKMNEIHPHLNFDLLGEMIEAAKEIDVQTPIYISAGLDEKLAIKHPEWLIRNKEDQTNWVSDFLTPGYHQFCMNSPYLDILIKQVEEVISNYDADGIFLDIVGVRECYCHNCLATLLERDKNPNNLADVIKLGEEVYANYTNRISKAVEKIKPGLKIFHNGGHIRKGRRDLAEMNTHLELESLPTGGWGYDHFPLSVRYAQTLNMDYLGMTGKFHTAWGEFGGYKHPNALRYEVSLSIANGARCSIGDQLHPSGKMDEATYSLIGKAYKEVKEKEQWCDNVKNIADVGLLSLEALSNLENVKEKAERSEQSEEGAVRMFLEGNILFDVIDLAQDFNQYKVIVLPDKVTVDSEIHQKLTAFVEAGGKILATGQSGMNAEKNGFEIDMGVNWISENPYQPDYFKPHFEVPNLGFGSYVFYGKGQKVELNDGGTELGIREDPYFNRQAFSFCSHLHTPSSKNNGGPGMVKSNKGIYIAWNVFQDYATKGSLILKETVLYALNQLLPNKVINTNLPAQGVTTLMMQEEHNRYINHLLYASPVKRGTDIEVIEDILPVYNTEVSLNLPITAKKVYLAPQMKELDFEQEKDTIRYIIPKLECHQMVVIE